ncbi:hypothetical protein IB61_05090 [Brucella abortus LMN2]|nr:hypothetical protein IB61_05090 [Brucella abortus LMN2]
MNARLCGSFSDTRGQVEGGSTQHGKLAGKSGFQRLRIFNIERLRFNRCSRFQSIKLRLRTVNNRYGIFARGGEKIGNGGADFACADDNDLFSYFFPLECNSDIQKSHSFMQKEACILTI